MSDGSTRPAPRITNGVASVAPEGVAPRWTFPRGAPQGDAPPISPAGGGELDFNETFLQPGSKLAPLSGRLTRKRTEACETPRFMVMRAKLQGDAQLRPAASPARRIAFGGAGAAVRCESRHEPTSAAGLVSPSSPRPPLSERRALGGRLQAPQLRAGLVDPQAPCEFGRHAPEGASGSLAHA